MFAALAVVQTICLSTEQANEGCVRGNVVCVMAEYLNGYFSALFTRYYISSLPVPDAIFQDTKSDYLGVS